MHADIQSIGQVDATGNGEVHRIGTLRHHPHRTPVAAGLERGLQLIGHVARLGLTHFGKDQLLLVGQAVGTGTRIEKDDAHIQTFDIRHLGRGANQVRLRVIDGAGG
jgi:hypothetical protein